MSQTQSYEAFVDNGPWLRLPYRFHRTGTDSVLVSNMVGEHISLSAREFQCLERLEFVNAPHLLRRLRGKHVIRREGETLPLELLALKTRTRFHRLSEFTGLHIFVVTLRCEHTCGYCQVSRQGSSRHLYDMSEETASAALDLAFRSPSRSLKIELQGGEPLLNFDLVRFIVTEAESRNEQHQKALAFVIATNLALLDDDVLDFAEAHGIHFSTSLDGPPELHNANRPRPGNDSWQRAVHGIRRIQSRLGPEGVAALMTTTEASLARPRAIIDAYLELGLHDVFLRPISPYGFAVRSRRHEAYDAQRWLEFYRDGLEYVLELNASGTRVVEHYARLILQKMLTNADPGYVDLTSPAGIGIGALVYNYEGSVYASDEGRMLAEMGDTTFRLGNVGDSYEQLLLNDVLLDALDESFAYSAPMCNDCAFECYCGADPVYHHATSGDVVGRKAESAFCRRNMGIFKLLLEKYENDGLARSTFLDWIRR